jgi:hypothetical protein
VLVHSREDRDREALDRLLLLLIAQPCEGFESEFADLIRREVEKLHVPDREPEGTDG